MLLEPTTVAEKGDQPGVGDPAPAEGLGAAPRRGPRRRHGRPARDARCCGCAASRSLLLAARRPVPQQRADRGARRALRVDAERPLATSRPSTAPFDLDLRGDRVQPARLGGGARSLGKNGVLVLASVTGGDAHRRGAGRPHQPGLRARQQGDGRHGQRVAATTSSAASTTSSRPRRSTRAGSSSCSRRPIDGPGELRRRCSARSPRTATRSRSTWRSRRAPARPPTVLPPSARARDGAAVHQPADRRRGRVRRAVRARVLPQGAAPGDRVRARARDPLGPGGARLGRASTSRSRSCR